MRYKSTTTGTQLPERWGLPDALRDDTGVIFASVFPGYDSFAAEMARYYADHARRDQLAVLEDLRDRMVGPNGQPGLRQEIDRRIADLQEAIAREPFLLDRRFLFRVLSMGHSQFAELIGARGPNTQLNSACASTDPGSRGGGRLDPRRPLPPGDCSLRGRHYVRPSDRMVRCRLPGQRCRGH